MKTTLLFSLLLSACGSQTEIGESREELTAASPLIFNWSDAQKKWSTTAPGKVALSADGKHLIVGSSDSVSVLDAHSGELLKTLESKDFGGDLTVIDDGTTLTVAANDVQFGKTEGDELTTVTLWLVGDGPPEQIGKKTLPGMLWNTQLTATHAVIIGQTRKFVPIPSGGMQLVETPHAHVWDLAADSVAEAEATGSRVLGGKYLVKETDGGLIVTPLTGEAFHLPIVGDPTLAPDGKTLFVTQDNTLSWWNLQTQQQVGSIAKFPHLWPSAVSLEAKLVLLSNFDAVLLVSLDDGDIVKSFINDGFQNAVFSPDGHDLYLQQPDGLQDWGPHGKCMPTRVPHSCEGGDLVF